MLATLIIVLRETIEAGLIVGIVLAATRGVRGRGWQVSTGVGAGIAGACVVAGFAGSISDAFQGSGQELLNSTILWLAVAMLGWHAVWMARHGREMASQMRNVGEEVRAGRRPVSALSVVVGVAVLREGSELVLFLYGIAVSGGARGDSMLAGGVLGLAGGVALAALTYFGLARLPAARLLRTTNWLVILLAAGLAAQAAALLQSAGVIDALSATVWDTSALLTDNSIGGRVLHTLVGYTERPSELQLAAWVATLLVLLALQRLLAPPPRPHRPAPARCRRTPLRN